jgi:integrase
VRIYGWRENVWYPAVEKARARGLRKKPRVHDLRHTCASWLIAAGIPLLVIQHHLGHESISTTVNLYGRLDRRSHEAAAAAIHSALYSSEGSKILP